MGQDLSQITQVAHFWFLRPFQKILKQLDLSEREHDQKIISVENSPTIEQISEIS